MSQSSSPSRVQESSPAVPEVTPQSPACDENNSLVQGVLIHKSHRKGCLFRTPVEILNKCVNGPSPDCPVCHSWPASQRSLYRARLRKYIAGCFTSGDSAPPCFSAAVGGSLLAILSAEGPSSSSPDPSNPWLSEEGLRYASTPDPIEESPADSDLPDPDPRSFRLLEWLQKYRPERVVSATPSQFPFPRELADLAPSASSLDRVPLNEGIAGSFLEGVNHHVSCPSGTAPDLWPYLQELTSPPEGQVPAKPWLKPLGHSSFLAEPSSFNFHRGLKALQPPPSPSGRVVKPSVSDVSGFGISSDLLRFLAESQECLSLLKAHTEDMESSDFYSILDHLLKINLGMASLVGRSASPFLANFRSQVLGHSSSSPSPSLAEPFTGPSILGPVGSQKWSFVPPLEVSALSAAASEISAAFSKGVRSLTASRGHSGSRRMFANRARSRSSSSRGAGVSKKPVQSSVARRGGRIQFRGRGSSRSSPAGSSSRASRKRV